MCQNICHSGGQSKNVFNQVWCEHFCPDVLVRACFSHAMRFTRQGSDKTCFLSCASWIFGALLLEILGYVFGSKNEVYTIDVTELILNAVALDARRFQTIFCFSAVPEKSLDPFGYWNASHILGLSFFYYWILIWLHCWVENCGYSWKATRYISGILNHVGLCPPVTSWKVQI
jgi:hypothetical protein